jgi:hypothetical protein
MFARSFLAAIALFALQANGFMVNNPALSRFSASRLACSSTSRVSLRTARVSGISSLTASAELKEQLKGARQAIADLVDKTNANPILVISRSGVLLRTLTPISMIMFELTTFVAGSLGLARCRNL